MDTSKKPFKLGHVFNLEELPEDKKHLAGWLYFGHTGNTMHLVETKSIAVHGGERGSYHDLEEHCQNLKNTSSPGAHMGFVKDYNMLASKKFKSKVGLSNHVTGVWIHSDFKPDPEYKFKTGDSETSTKDTSLVNHPDNIVYNSKNPANNPKRAHMLYSLHGDATHSANKVLHKQGRIFQDVPIFEPIN